jgi:ABC-type multidrug transport system fused ATPase/permease subunit
VRSIRRCIRYYQLLWRAWTPLVVLSVVTPIAALGLALVEKSLVDDVLVNRRIDLLLPTLGWYAGLWAISAIAQSIYGILYAYVGERLGQRIRAELLDHCYTLSLSLSNREHTGRTMSLFTNDATVVTGLLAGTALGGMSNVLIHRGHHHVRFELAACLDRGRDPTGRGRAGMGGESAAPPGCSPSAG